MGNNPCNDPVSLSQISARQPKNLLSSTNVPSRGEYCAQTSQTAVAGAEGYSGYQTGRQEMEGGDSTVLHLHCHGQGQFYLFYLLRFTVHFHLKKRFYSEGKG